MRVERERERDMFMTPVSCCPFCLPHTTRHLPPFLPAHPPSLVPLLTNSHPLSPLRLSPTVDIQAPMAISAPKNDAFMEAAIPCTEASAPLSQAFIELSAISGFIDKSAHSPMETLMPNTSQAFKNSHTSMTTVEEPPCHRRKGCPTRRIDHSSTSGQVMFCKRRNGLFKKAHELSVLCDVEIAAIVFSPSGKISEFASSSMSHIIKRYQSFQPQMPSNNVLLQDVENWRRQAILLNSEIKRLQYFQSCVFEENNMNLSINEVQSVESMLEHTLDMIRKRKMELLEVETHSIIEKGEIICKENTMLKEKLMKIMSTKECVSNASSGCKELCYDQDVVNTKLQLGLDILQCTQEENSYSSKN